MKKRMGNNIIWLVSIFMFLAGCLPAPSPRYWPATNETPFKHYAPPKESGIFLEFDFPREWMFSFSRYPYPDLIIIGLEDPRIRTVPTPIPGVTHPPVHSFGSVYIHIQSLKENQTLEEFVDPFRQAHRVSNWIAELDDYGIVLDGYEAIVLEYRLGLAVYSGYSAVMFQRDVFFIARGQIYQISFIVAEKERGGEFEQGYEYFFKSLKIVE